MAKEKKDSEIKAIIEQAISDSEHINDGHLAKEREKVLEYYRGEQPKPMFKGDSKYVSRDVYDTVDSARATLLESFMASTRIVFFRPERGETVDGAKQATEYCRHVFFKDNPGEDILYDVATEGLLKRFAMVKVYYEETTEEEEYEFEDLTINELTASVTEHDNYEFKDTDISEEGLYSGSYVVTTVNKGIKCEAVQPEDLMIKGRSASLKDAEAIIHRYTKKRSDLLKEGYDKKLIDKINFDDVSDDFFSYEKQQRFEPIDGQIFHDHATDEAGQTTNVYEVYIHIDLDGSNRHQLWKFVYAGDQILDRERVSRFPFASFVPLPVPHTYHGENYGDFVIPIQNARTVLVRQIMNHSLKTNVPRHQVLNGTVQNPNELMDNRPGGIVNVRRMDGIAPIPQQPLNPFVFQLIQMIDEDKEEVSGISKLSQGMNKDAVSSQNSEGMVENLMNASQQRTKIITRRFGKFLKDLYHLIYHTAVDYIDEETFVEVLGEYVEVNPSEWQNRSAASIELTLSYAEEEREAQKWTEIDQYFSQDPMLAHAYTPENRYEVISRALEKRGIEDIQAILTPPDQIEPKEPSEAEKLELEEKRVQVEYLKAQAKSMTDKSESDRLKAEAELIKAKSDAKSRALSSRRDAADFKHRREMDIEELELSKQVQDDNKSASYAPNN